MIRDSLLFAIAVKRRLYSANLTGSLRDETHGWVCLFLCQSGFDFVSPTSPKYEPLASVPGSKPSSSSWSKQLHPVYLKLKSVS